MSGAWGVGAGLLRGVHEGRGRAEAEFLLRGQSLFQPFWSTVQTPEARGDGSVGRSLSSKPASFVAMSGMHSDGDFAWKISTGQGTMPAWKFPWQENWRPGEFHAVPEGTTVTPFGISAGAGWGARAMPLPKSMVPKTRQDDAKSGTRNRRRVPIARCLAAGASSGGRRDDRVTNESGGKDGQDDSAVG